MKARELRTLSFSILKLTFSRNSMMQLLLHYISMLEAFHLLICHVTLRNLVVFCFSSVNLSLMLNPNTRNLGKREGQGNIENCFFCNFITSIKKTVKCGRGTGNGLYSWFYWGNSPNFVVSVPHNLSELSSLKETLIWDNLLAGMKNTPLFRAIYPPSSFSAFWMLSTTTPFIPNQHPSPYLPHLPSW